MQTAVGGSDDRPTTATGRQRRISDDTHEEALFVHDFERADYSDVLDTSTVSRQIKSVEMQLHASLFGLDALKDFFIPHLATFRENAKARD